MKLDKVQRRSCSLPAAPQSSFEVVLSPDIIQGLPSLQLIYFSIAHLSPLQDTCLMGVGTAWQPEH